MGNMLPFLKWAGGKRWLVQSGQLPRSQNYSRLVEPFLGGAGVFFGLRPTRALLGDVNDELINLYITVRDRPKDLEAALISHQARHCANYYYLVRGQQESDSLIRAARTLYLNRTCWNGLYRVNRNGQFNVPIGTKSSVVMPGEDLQAIAKALSVAEIVCSDFECTIDQTAEGDFLFVDPPYTVKHNMNGFLKYNERIFSWEDQVRLRDALVRAASRGASIALTNADHETVRNLYEDRFSYRSLARASVLAGKATARGATSEALFTINL